MRTPAAAKLLFAQAIKQLLPSTPIEKIHVSQLCELCGLHRKSFYYHFYDKYDLINWIFDFEVMHPLRENTYHDLYEFLRDLILRLDTEKEYYRACFRMERATSFGNTSMNSFQDHFIHGLKYFIKRYSITRFLPSQMLTREKQMEFYLDTVAGSLMGNIQQWLLEQQSLAAEAYIELLMTARPF